MRAKLHKGDIHQELAQSVIFDSASSAHHFEDNSLTSFRFSIPSDHFLRQSEERFMIGLKSLTFTKTFRKNADINYEDLHVAFLLRNIPGVSGARYFPVKFKPGLSSAQEFVTVIISHFKDMQQRLPGVPEVVNAALEIWFSPDKKHFALFNTGIDMVFSIELYEKLKAFSTVSDSDPFSEGAKRVYFSTGADQTFSVQFQDIDMPANQKSNFVFLYRVPEMQGMLKNLVAIQSNFVVETKHALPEVGIKLPARIDIMLDQIIPPYTNDASRRPLLLTIDETELFETAYTYTFEASRIRFLPLYSNHVNVLTVRLLDSQSGEPLALSAGHPTTVDVKFQPDPNKSFNMESFTLFVNSKSGRQLFVDNTHSNFRASLTTEIALAPQHKWVMALESLHLPGKISPMSAVRNTKEFWISVIKTVTMEKKGEKEEMEKVGVLVEEDSMFAQENDNEQQPPRKKSRKYLDDSGIDLDSVSLYEEEEDEEKKKKKAGSKKRVLPIDPNSLLFYNFYRASMSKFTGSDYQDGDIEKKKVFTFEKLTNFNAATLQTALVAAVSEAVSEFTRPEIAAQGPFALLVSHTDSNFKLTLELKSKADEELKQTPNAKSIVYHVALSPLLAHALGASTYDNRPKLLQIGAKKKPDGKVEMSTDLISYIEFEKPIKIERLNPSLMYIFCDVLKSSLVGRGYHRLLKAVPVRDSSFAYHFDKLDYVPLDLVKFSNLSFRITDQSMHELEFQDDERRNDITLCIKVMRL